MIANLSSDGLSVRKTLNEEGREAYWELDLAKRGAPCGANADNLWQRHGLSAVDFPP